jgi:hypothetical protein
MAEDIFDGYETRSHNTDLFDLTIGVQGQSLIIVIRTVRGAFALNGFVAIPGLDAQRGTVRGSAISVPIHPNSASPIVRQIRCPAQILRQGVAFVYDFCEVDHDMLLLAEGGMLTMSHPQRTGHEVYWEQDPLSREGSLRYELPPEE